MYLARICTLSLVKICNFRRGGALFGYRTTQLLSERKT